jgi:UDP:flavonoid glycosyltransferase YjiC (YdhE family)
MPGAWADAIFQRSYPLAFRLHCMPFNRLCKAFGLEPSFSDIRELYTWGDVTLFADLPDLIRHRNLPPSCVYLGPLLWAPSQDPPAWWGQWQAAPLVYLNLGSSGPAYLLDRLIRWCVAAGWQVSVATGPNQDVAERWAADPRVFCAPVLAGDLAARAADAVICNGGSPSAYQALAEGKPTIGVCENLDQYLDMAALEPLGATLGLRSDAVISRQLRDALDWAAGDGALAGAQEARRRIAKADAIAVFLMQLAELFPSS